MNRSPRSYRIGEVAAAAGVSVDTVRHYERRGVLPRAVRDRSGYRRFSESAVQRVHVIRRALEAGFSLDELSRILRVRDAGGAPCRAVYSIAEARLRELDERVAMLQQLRGELHAMLQTWTQLLESAAPGTRLGLLDAWAAQRPTGDRGPDERAPARKSLARGLAQPSGLRPRVSSQREPPRPISRRRDG